MNKILLIITGSIAASKCKEIITLLNINEVKISCILTNEAKKYVKISDIKKLTLLKGFLPIILNIVERTIIYALVYSLP